MRESENFKMKYHDLFEWQSMNQDQLKHEKKSEPFLLPSLLQFFYSKYAQCHYLITIVDMKRIFHENIQRHRSNKINDRVYGFYFKRFYRELFVTVQWILKINLFPDLVSLDDSVDDIRLTFCLRACFTVCATCANKYWLPL